MLFGAQSKGTDLQNVLMFAAFFDYVPQKTRGTPLRKQDVTNDPELSQNLFTISIGCN